MHKMRLKTFKKWWKYNTKNIELDIKSPNKNDKKIFKNTVRQKMI